MTIHETGSGNVPVSSIQGRAPGAGAGDDAQQLRDRISVLLQENTALRQANTERASLEDRVAQLCDANQHLVLATVSAQTQQDEAEAVNRRQNEFLAMLAHELRNPLAPISMAATLLGRLPDASPQLLEFQGVIQRQVEYLTRLLDDLLDAARISSGKVTLLLQPLELADIIERTLETVRSRIAQRHQRLDIDLPDELLMVDGDPVRLVQAFSNLLVNASKYTQDHGVIVVRAARLGDDAVVVVEDNGAGMSADIIPHIFDLFTQGPRSLARSEGGLGVGLNVVRSVVQMHRGRVEARSAGPGRGSTFCVTLPLRAQRPSIAPAAPATAAPPAPARRILVVEDNVDACDMMRSFLELEGHAVSVAYDGVRGLAMARADAYDVLICDIGLPRMDGLDLIRALRGSAGGSAPFAIALSGYGQAQDQARARAAGFDEYAVKPVSVAALRAMLVSSAQRPAGPY